MLLRPCAAHRTSEVPDVVAIQLGLARAQWRRKEEKRSRVVGAHMSAASLALRMTRATMRGSRTAHAGWCPYAGRSKQYRMANNGRSGRPRQSVGDRWKVREDWHGAARRKDKTNDTHLVPISLENIGLAGEGGPLAGMTRPFAELILANDDLVPKPNLLREARNCDQVKGCCLGLVARCKRALDDWSLVSLPRECYDHIPGTALATRLAMRNTTYGSLLPLLSAAGSSLHPRI